MIDRRNFMKCLGAALCAGFAVMALPIKAVVGAAPKTPSVITGNGNEMVVVKLVKDGGIAGDQHHDCTFTYTASHTGRVLATGLKPNRPRFPKCKFQPGTIGYMAFRDGELIYFEALNECPVFWVCE